MWKKNMFAWFFLWINRFVDLNKSEVFFTNTTTASKYILRSPRICINWNLPYQTLIDLVKVPLNVNIVKQDLLHKKQFFKILWSKVWKKDFQLVLILYFDAVVIFVKNTFIQIGSGHTVLPWTKKENNLYNTYLSTQS